MFFFVINWKLSPHKIDFSGLHKETFGEISKLQSNCFISCQGPNGLLSMFVGQYERH